MDYGLGLRVQGLGFRAEGSEYYTQLLKEKYTGLARLRRFRTQALGKQHS